MLLLCEMVCLVRLVEMHRFMILMAVLGLLVPRHDAMRGSQEIAPDKIVSEAAYVLFYRRRRLTPSNVINMTI